MSNLSKCLAVSTGFAVGTGDIVNDHAKWLDPQEMNDFMIVPTDIISPLHLFIASKKKVLLESGVVFLQIGDDVGAMKHMAFNCFFDIPCNDLTTLCEERDLHPASPDLYGTLKVVLSDELKDISVHHISDILLLRTRTAVDQVSELISDDMMLYQLVPPSDAGPYTRNDKCVKCDLYTTAFHLPKACVIEKSDLIERSSALTSIKRLL